MDKVIPFTYIHGNSVLHLLDTRCKFFIICIISISMLSADLLSILLYFIIILLFMKTSGLKILKALHGIRYFLVLLFFIFLSRSITTQGETIFSFLNISVSMEGVKEGFLIAFKFFLIMLTGLIVSSTTNPSSVKGAVQWFLKPLPFIPEQRVSIMISLSLKFIPVILKQAQQISDARRARCSDLEKNPVKKITGLAIPLLKKTFLSADGLILAMEARCYSDDRTDPEFHPSGKELLFISGSVVVSTGFICF